MRKLLATIIGAAVLALGAAVVPAHASTDVPYVATWLGREDARLQRLAQDVCDAPDQATADAARAQYETIAARLQHHYTQIGDEHHVASVDLAESHMTQTSSGEPCSPGPVFDDCCYNRPLLQTWDGVEDGRLFYDASQYCATTGAMRQQYATLYGDHAADLSDAYQAEGNPQSIPTVQEAAARICP